MRILPPSSNPRTPETWDHETDVLVIGFGGAGACAAIEARERGAQVLAVERFTGGGATRMSGGIIYLGGGTRQQVQAGVEDTAEAMEAYLKLETRGVVNDETLRTFCQESVSMGAWLEERGVPLGAALSPYKTSYPVAKHTLYYSGNEPLSTSAAHAKPAQRGHRTRGRGLPGGALFSALAQAALNRGVSLWTQTRVSALLTSQEGAVIGARAHQCTGLRSLAHRALDSLMFRARYGLLAAPGVYTLLDRVVRWIERGARVITIRARRGVILAAGGFIHDREMIATFAPAYLPGTPLGTLGDDGSGIRMGAEVGGVTDRMERVTAWRFINPPISFTSGVLVGPSGGRVCNEEVYGALMGRRMVEDHEGQAWLILDRALWRQAHRELGPSKANWFQSVPAIVNLWWNRHRGVGVAALARKMGVDVEALSSTLETYNRDSEHGTDALGKSAGSCRTLDLKGPLYAIDCSLGSRLFTCATLTLGGLRVDERSGAVLTENSLPISGLYAAGRTAVGVTSEGYVSGLSIADAVFSGRRAARAATQSERVNEGKEQTIDPDEVVWTTEAG